MFRYVVTRAITGELFRVFFLAWASLTGLLLLATVVTEATRNGLGPLQILMSIPLIVPTTLPYTLPTTTLFATCVVYGRLSADNEVLAIKSAGIHPLKIVSPALLLGATATLVTAGLSVDTIPMTKFLLKRQLIQDVQEVFMAALKRDGSVSMPNWDICVGRVQGDKLIDAQFMKKSPDGKGFEMIVIAQEAKLEFDLPQKTIRIMVRHGHLLKGNNNNLAMGIDGQIFPIEMPQGFDLGNMRKTRPPDMNFQELFAALEESKKSEADLRLDQQRHKDAIDRGNAPAHFQNVVETRQREIDFQIGLRASIYGEMQERPAVAFGCFCFVLVGCPVGIWFSKSDYLSSFITCFLPIILVYYPLLLCTINLGKSVRGHPAIIWTADGVLLAVGLFLMGILARK